MRVIEFLGVPGSGKSTTWAQLTELAEEWPHDTHDEMSAVRLGLAKRGSDPISKVAARTVGSLSDQVWKKAFARSTDRVPALVRAMTSRPQLASTIVDAHGAHNQTARADMVLGWMLNLLINYQIAEESLPATDWLLLDEGFCNRVISLYAADQDRPIDEKEVRTYLSQIAQPEVLVVMSTPVPVCKQRLDKKGWTPRLKDKSEAERLMFLERSADLVGITADAIRAAGTTVIDLDGTAPSGEMRRTLQSEFVGLDQR